MQKKLMLIALVVILVVIGIIVYNTVLRQTGLDSFSSTSNDPQQTAGPPRSEDDIDQPYEGEIVDITSQTVAYKNSQVMTLSTEQGQYQVYVTEETIIYSLYDEMQKERSFLQSGMSVSVKGDPAEGGIEAQNIYIIK